MQRLLSRTRPRTNKQSLSLSVCCCCYCLLWLWLFCCFFFIVFVFAFFLLFFFSLSSLFDSHFLLLDSVFLTVLLFFLCLSSVSHSCSPDPHIFIQEVHSNPPAIRFQVSSDVLATKFSSHFFVECRLRACARSRRVNCSSCSSKFFAQQKVRTRPFLLESVPPTPAGWCWSCFLYL